MSDGAGPHIWHRELVNLAACAAGVGCAAWAYAALPAGRANFAPWSLEWILGLSITGAACWLAVASSDRERGGGLRLWIDQFFSAVGLSLVALYGLGYLFSITPAPWQVVVAGCALSLGLIRLLDWLLVGLSANESQGILFLGFGPVASALAPVLRGRILGVVDDDPNCASAQVPYLGGPDRFGEVVAAQRPDCIIVSAPEGPSRGVSPRQLLDLRYSGIVIESGPALYENMLYRVKWDRLDPLDVLFSAAWDGSRAALAFHAVYTNLIGLGLLLALSPVLIVTALAVAVFSGGAPMERVECLGFQRMPLRLLRFRTRRADGERTWIGKVIARLHVVNLPQLINVVRGEMALFGPPPVRQGFAERLSRIMPCYTHRFAVKPGILGWSQVNLRGPGLPDESVRLEYDLYYVKQESPSLDLDIFILTLFRAVFSVRTAPRTGEETL